MINVPVDDGKYTVIQDDDGLRITRYGEPWLAGHQLAGDKCIISLACELEEAREEVTRLQGENGRLEELRPHWAEGHTDDGVAAQAYLNAKLQLWDLLGVKDQTAAVLELRRLQAAAEQDSERIKVLEAILREAYEWIDDCGAQAGCQTILDTIDAALAPVVTI